jgi:hypothetical protein
MAELNNEITQNGVAFGITIKQTKATADSASYIVIAKSHNNSSGISYFFGKDEYSSEPATLTIQHKNSSNFENIYVVSGADASNDNNYTIKYWCFPALSGWNKVGYHYYRNGLELSKYHNKDLSDKVQGRITGTTITSKEYTVKIPRGSDKVGYKTVQARVLGDGTYGDFKTQTASLSLRTTSISSAKLDSFTVTQSDKDSKDRKITVNVKITNPENYYTLIVKHNKTEIYNEKGSSEFCIEIPITREMYSSMQTFSVTVVCANGEIELAEKTREIFIEDAGVGVSYKDELGKIHEVEEIWYKDKEGNISEISEVWVKKAKQVVKTIK